jgi:thiol:disulfide interchange protein
MKKNERVHIAALLPLALLLILMFSLSGYGQFGRDRLGGPVVPEIDTEIKYDEGLILFKFDLDESHHITDVKNGFFTFKVETNEFIEVRDVIYPEGVPYADEIVFKGRFKVKVYIKQLKPLTAPVKLKFNVSYQICQEHPQEVCFPPDETSLDVTVQQVFKEVKIEKKAASAAFAQLKDFSSQSGISGVKPKGGDWQVIMLLGLGLLAVAVLLGLSGWANDDGMGAKFVKAIAALLVLGGAFLFLKGMDIKNYPERYAMKPKNTATLNWVHDLEKGKALAKQENKPVMIDTWAEWCVACRELEEYTFSDAEVAKVLDDYVVIKVDFTKFNEENDALRRELKVIGMPTVIFLDPEGKELKRFSGFLNKDKFLAFLGAEKGWFDRAMDLLTRELDKKSLLVFGLIFVLGFLTSLTPCVYPVIPIVMGYIGTRSGDKKLKGFYLSIFFVLGLAFVYSILGVIAAMSGEMMGSSFQNPVVVIVISSIFIVMGLSLAGLFEIPVPASISSKVRSGGGKSEIIGALVMGGVAGIIAAPCVGPVLIALLTWISQTKDAVLGFFLTFTFSLGMGVIFLVLGTFSGVISAMPKGGKWMDHVKYFFSVLLIAGGIYIVDSIAPDWVNLLLWGIFLVALAVFVGLFKTHEEYAFKQKIYKFIVIIVFLTGIFMFSKALEIKFFTTTTTPAPIAAKTK